MPTCRRGFLCALSPEWSLRCCSFPIASAIQSWSCMVKRLFGEVHHRSSNKAGFQKGLSLQCQQVLCSLTFGDGVLYSSVWPPTSPGVEDDLEPLILLPLPPEAGVRCAPPFCAIGVFCKRRT